MSISCIEPDLVQRRREVYYHRRSDRRTLTVEWAQHEAGLRPNDGARVIGSAVWKRCKRKNIAPPIGLFSC